MKLIPLSSGYFSMVDDEDFERVNAFKWSASRNRNGNQVYAQSVIGGKTTMLHRFILNARAGLLVDHRNGTHEENFLDNQRSNLREASHCLNQRNTASRDGVWFRKTRNRWIAMANVNRKLNWIGSFLTQSEAFAALEKWKSEVKFRDSEVPALATEALKSKGA